MKTQITKKIVPIIIMLVLCIATFAAVVEAKRLNERLAGQRFVPASLPSVKVFKSGGYSAIPSPRESVIPQFEEVVRTTGTPNSNAARLPTNMRARGTRSESDVAARLTEDPTSYSNLKSEETRGKYFDRKYTPPPSLRGNYRRAWYTKAYQSGNPVIASKATSSTPRFVNNPDRERVSTNSYLDNSPAY